MQSHDLMRLLIYFYVAAININRTADGDVSITLRDGTKLDVLYIGAGMLVTDQQRMVGRTWLGEVAEAHNLPGSVTTLQKHTVQELILGFLPEHAKGLQKLADALRPGPGGVLHLCAVWPPQHC